MINGQAHDFFHSSRGVKQEVPLSPFLFILVAEVLFLALNSIFRNQEFKSYELPKWSDNLNHLATIIFATANRTSLQLIMRTLSMYEQQSDQLINKDKSSFDMFNKVVHNSVQLVEDVPCFSKGKFPLKYMGCPIGHVK